MTKATRDTDPRPHCFQVREAEESGDVKLYCPECIQGYVGDADINEIPLSAVGDTALCGGCGADLSNPEGYDHAGC